MKTYPDPTPEQMQRLREFAAKHGVQWRAALRHLWARNGDENDPLLRQVRNQIGEGIYRIKL